MRDLCIDHKQKLFDTNDTKKIEEYVSLNARSYKCKELNNTYEKDVDKATSKTMASGRESSNHNEHIREDETQTFDDEINARPYQLDKSNLELMTIEKRKVVESKISASRALRFINSSSRKEESGDTRASTDSLQSIEKLLNNLCFASSNIAKRFNKKNSEGNNGTEFHYSSFDTLCFNSEYLNNEKHNHFLILADNIIQQHQCSGTPLRFLSSLPLRHGKDHSTKFEIWPRWLHRCVEYKYQTKNGKNRVTALVPFYILLLAKIESSILDSYYNSINNASSKMIRGVDEIELNSPITNKNKQSTNFTDDSNGINLCRKSTTSTLENHKEQLAIILSHATKFRLLSKKMSRERCLELLHPQISPQKLFPINKSCPCPERPGLIFSCDDFQLDQLLFTPLTYVLQASQFSYPNGENVDFITCVANLSKQFNLKALEANSLLAQEVLSNVGNVSTTSSTRGSKTSRNKKKKKNKKVSRQARI